MRAKKEKSRSFQCFKTSQIMKNKQRNLETLMRESNFIFDSIQLMYCKYRKINFLLGGSYIDSADWMKKKNATINPKNTYGKCFQYPETVALSYEEIKLNPEGVSNIKPSINKYNYRGKNYPSKIDDWKTFEKNNRQLLLVFCILKKNKYVQLISQKLIQTVKNKTYY